MAWVRQLPSGLWAATVYTPAGRITESHEVKSIVAKWAADLEADIRRGEFHDPRLAKTQLGEVWEKYKDSRRLEKASRLRDESTWKTWVAPRWAKVEVGAILKPDVQSWVNELEQQKVGGWTIIAALNVMKASCELAVDAGLIRANPARRVRAPIPPEHVDRVLTAEEEVLILERLDELFPGRRDARLFVETLLDTGARWEDIAAVKREAVNLREALISLGPVMERDGRIRSYPKGARSRGHAGFRDVVVGDDLWRRLRPVVMATKPDTVVFSAPAGGHLLYPTWRSRVWVPTLRVPVLDSKGVRVKGVDGKPLWEPLVDEPLPTPHDLRHTFGTRLAEAGVELHDRMAAMGQDDIRSGQRYTHSSNKRHDRVKAALRAARGG
jgi:site-specific recombinase XerD